MDDFGHFLKNADLLHEQFIFIILKGLNIWKKDLEIKGEARVQVEVPHPHWDLRKSHI